MKKVLAALGLVVALAAAAIGGYIVGRNTTPAADAVIGTTFYATIEEINGSHLLVKGLEVNDINSRGRFSFTLQDSTKLEWRYTPLLPDELQAGDTVAVTYTGEIQETEPATIREVLKVQLLDDEK